MITIATTILRRRLQHHRQKYTHTLDTHTREIRMPVRNTSKYRQPRALAAVVAAAAAQATAVGPKRLPVLEPLAHTANTTCAKRNTCMNVEAHTVLPVTRTSTKHIATYNLPAMRAVPVAAATSILGAVRSRILVPVVQATTGERRLWSKMALAVGRESIVVDFLLLQFLGIWTQPVRLHHTLHTILSWPAMFSFFNSASHLVHIPFQFYSQLLSTDRSSTTHYTHSASYVSSFKQASATITTPRTQFSAAESQESEQNDSPCSTQQAKGMDD